MGNASITLALNHINNLRNYPDAEFSPAALEAHERGEKVLIEHVSPTTGNPPVEDVLANIEAAERVGDKLLFRKNLVKSRQSYRRIILLYMLLTSSLEGS